MKRREFIKSLGAAIALPGMLAAVPEASGGVVSTAVPDFLNTGCVLNEMQNPVAIMRDILVRSVGEENVDHNSFNRAIRECDERVSIKLMPDETPMDAIGMLAEKTETAVWLDGGFPGGPKIRIMPAEVAAICSDERGRILETPESYGAMEKAGLL